MSAAPHAERPCAWHEPEPLTETPPYDRYCDLILTGGVASGVVYPWAILELARHYRFKSIGGTSVGAMAAALAAAAEYGRRHGRPEGFEVLRRLPGELAEELNGRTRLLSLFQPARRGRRLLALFIEAVRHSHEPDDTSALGCSPAKAKATKWPAVARKALRLYAPDIFFCSAPVVLGLAVLWSLLGDPVGWHWLWALLPATLIAGTAGLLGGLWRDLRKGLVANDLGLCRGGPMQGHDEPGLMQWLHDGIQQAAGLPLRGKPLTFADLWSAPLRPGAGPPADFDPADPRQRAINLEMVTTNISHARPYRLPLQDQTSRLFFRPDDLKTFFPPSVLEALVQSAAPYRPRSSSDPPPAAGAGLLELPGGALPVVVAARLSLSFPLLFSAVPLYAIDYEMHPAEARRLKRCRFSDGGLCSNFPIHLFDSAVPRWPTFGMWLDRRSPYRRHRPVWLPEYHFEGRGDSWLRFEPCPADVAPGSEAPDHLGTLGGFLLGALASAKDWGDHSSMRLPQVRNRVARLGLESGEGQLNIAMTGDTIMKMAHDYGTATGRLLVERFVPDPRTGQTTPAWKEHVYVRLQTLMSSLRGMLKGASAAACSSAYTQTLDQVIADAVRARPLRGRPGLEVLFGEAIAGKRMTELPDAGDAAGARLTPQQAAALRGMLEALGKLEDALEEGAEQPYRPVPAPELRMRPPV